MTKNIKAAKEMEEVIKEDVVEEQESSDDEVIEKKTAKEKKPYVLTQARKEQFEKARMIRQEKLNIAKAEKESKQNEIKNLELELKDKQDKKVNKKKDKIIQRIEAEETSDEEEEEEIIVQKPKKKL